MGNGGPSGGLGGILKNIIVFIINYGYIPFQWFLKRSSNNKLNVDLSALQVSKNNLIVMTGATGGLGTAVLTKLLELDADVVVGVRNLEETKPILQSIRHSTTAGNLTSLKLDLTSLESIRSFAKEVTAKDKGVGVLINAAGVQGGPYQLTKDGYELQFQVNYLSHFLLTNLLLPRMTLTSTETNPAVILNVSSIVQKHGKFDLQNLNSEKWYNSAQAYFNSKLNIAASSHFLGLRLKQKGIQTTVNSIHPGFLSTKQWDNYCIGFLRNFWKNKLLPPSSGADDVLFVAFHPEASRVTGSFYLNQTVDPTVPNLKWKDLEELWDISCDMVKIPNIYSLSPPKAKIDQKLNNEILLDLDLEGGKNGNKKLLNKNSRTLSVITINNLEPNIKKNSLANDNPRFLQRGESQIFSISSTTDAVAPVETDVAGLANVAALNGIMSSTDNLTNIA